MAALVPVTLNDRPLGYLLVGDPLTQALLQHASVVSQGSITLVDARGLPLVSSADDADARALAAGTAACASGFEEIEVSGVRHLRSAMPTIGLAGEPVVCTVVTRSLAPHLAELRARLRWLVAPG